MVRLRAIVKVWARINTLIAMNRDGYYKDIVDAARRLTNNQLLDMAHAAGGYMSSKVGYSPDKVALLEAISHVDSPIEELNYIRRRLDIINPCDDLYQWEDLIKLK